MRLYASTILFLCIVLAVVVALVYPKGSEEEPHDEDTSTFPFVLTNINENVSVLPGGMVVVVIETIVPDSVSVLLKRNDTVIVKSPLIHAEKKSFALLGIPHTISSGEYMITVDAGDDSIDVNAHPKPLFVKEKKFFVEEVPLSKSLTKRRTNNSLNLEVVAQAKNIWNLTGKIFHSDRYAYDKFTLPLAEYDRFTGMFADKRTYVYSDGRRIDSVAHHGIDIAAYTGTDVTAPASGRVVMVKDRIVTGKTIVISHFSGIFSLYHHLSSTSTTKEGDIVKTGDKIGKVGSTGFSTGPHLHWEVRVNNIRVDPILMMETLDKIMILKVQYTYNK